MGENPKMPYPMQKKHELSNNNDAPSTTKCGFLVLHRRVFTFEHCLMTTPCSNGETGCWLLRGTGGGGAPATKCCFCAVLLLLTLMLRVCPHRAYQGGRHAVMEAWLWMKQ